MILEKDSVKYGAHEEQVIRRDIKCSRKQNEQLVFWQAEINLTRKMEYYALLQGHTELARPVRSSRISYCEHLFTGSSSESQA